LQKDCRCPVAISDVKRCLAKKIVGIRHCAAAFFLHVLKLCKDLDLILLYISVLGTYSKCVRENLILMLAGRFASRSRVRALAAGLPRQDHV